MNNAIIPLLHALLKEQAPSHGKALLSDLTLLRNLLADYAPQHRAERNLLLRAVEENIPAEIAAQAKQGEAPDPLLMGRWVKRLETDHGIASENAQWAVRVWVKALGRKMTENRTPPSPVPQVKVSPPTPKINAPRPTGFTLPLLEWCDIPEGYVTIEEQKILVPAFRMAKYPVTYAQFQAFIDAPDGYRSDHWWRGLAQRDKAPGEQEWKIDKHPRENVNWYESMTFSRWLGAKTGLSVTLPTESQWQRAAQGDDGREYPWGNGFDKARCNTRQSGINKTTPVDQYPKGASPFGVVDMAGNVWEWCLSKWADPYQHPEDNTPEGDSPRVLRGGSWNLSVAYRARAAYRNYGGFPSIRFNYRGFRVVVAPVSL